MAARYDGQTEWYEEIASTEAVSNAREAGVRMVGAGPGRLLDFGCGTGLSIPALVAAGWTVVGVDISADQLRAAQRRLGDGVELLQADAHALPFADEEFHAVAAFFTHTDFDDVPRAFSEAARVLRRGGTFVQLGVHPCFGSPFVQWGEEGPPVIRPGYRDAGWHRLEGDEQSPKIRARVGINHLPLAGLVNAIVDSGLVVERVEEPGDEDPPLFLGIRALKSESGSS